MSPITRTHHGTARIPASLLTDLDWTLDMDTAAPVDKVHPIAERLRAYDRDLNRDAELNHADGIHDWLTVLEVDAVQQLHASARPCGDRVEVDGRWLSEVRNVLNALTLSWGTECGDYLDASDYPPAEYATAKTAVDDGRMCYRCLWCRFLVMRDRIDVLLDAQGFAGGPYYQPCVDDPGAVWRDRVMAAIPA